jgi:cell division protein ZipA
MMSELRWALLILGVLFIVALALWERRRPRQARGAFERMPLHEAGAESTARLVREPPLTLPEVRVREPVAAAELPVIETRADFLPVLEPAPSDLEDDLGSPQSRHAFPTEEPPLEAQAPTADDEDTVDDLPTIIMSAEPTARDDSIATAPPLAPTLREALPELPPATPLLVEWPAENERHILALRLVAPQRERFAGRSLRQALAAEGFLLGQFAIFHKPDDERRAVLSAASLTRPGTFDTDTMDSQHYQGLSLFAVLPGPIPAPQAFDELVFAARNLNERLHGVLQDEQGSPLTPARIEQLREQLRPGAAS